MLKRVCAVLAILAAASASPAFAKDFPSRNITIIVPQPPGGGTDIISRVIGQQLSLQLGVPVVIENRTGAGTVVGTEAGQKRSRTGTHSLPA